MDHIVRFTDPSGQERIEDVGSLDAAIARVEALHNEEGVSSPRLYREVRVEFKTYVKASVVDDSVASATSSASRTSSASTASAEPSEAASQAAAAPSEPPPGAMPLNPQRPTATVHESVDEGATVDEDGLNGSPRRTLFSRS